MMGAMKESSTGSNQVMQSLANLINLTEDVKKSSKEMNEKTGLIESSMSSVSDLSDQNIVGIIEVSSGIAEISKAMIELSRLGSDNTDNVRILETEISKFNTTQDIKDDILEVEETGITTKVL